MAGAAKHTQKKAEFSGVCIFSFLPFYFSFNILLKELMLHAFSISLEFTGAFRDGSAVLWKEAVKLLCVMLPSRYTVWIVIAATVNLCILLILAAWFILLLLCKASARENFWLSGTRTLLKSNLGMRKGMFAYFLYCGTVHRGNSLLNTKLVDIHSHLH